MTSETHILQGSARPGTYALQAHRFGAPGQGPKVYIQAALHADEVPAILVAHQLKDKLTAAERRGTLRAEVVLVPMANPIGAEQVVHGQLQGRFDLRDGNNFNRGYAELGPRVVQLLEQDGRPATEANVRQALRSAAAELAHTTPAQSLKSTLLALAADAHYVLDLHCDSQAQMHLYAFGARREEAVELGALLGARAVLLATESGGGPFDEACSRPWLDVQKRYPQAGLPLGCFSCTVELRGEGDTDLQQAQSDAEAIMEFLRRRGLVHEAPAVLAQPMCDATPLASLEPIVAPCSGVVAYRCELGQRVTAGEVIADIVDACTGAVTPVACTSAGLFFARASTRWAVPGKRLGKIAGTTLNRTGALLSP